MKKNENRIVSLNHIIIEQFDNNNEMLLIKGGGKFWKWLKDKFTNANCKYCNNGC